MTNQVASLTVRVGADTSDVRQKFNDLERISASFGRRITGAFEDAVFSGQSLGETLHSLALDLSKLSLRAALQPLQAAASSGFAELFSGLTGFATGGVVGGSMPRAFAEGGVVASPITFPLGNGRTGVAGEAGPEAILPLARGADGRLGVHAGGSGGNAITVHMNISTPDAESFRRSESQIAAMLTRTAGRGQRNL